MNISDILQYAKKVDNYEKDATGATALWPADTTYVATCPTGKRWFLIGGVIKPDVNATAMTIVFNSSDEPLYQVGYQAASTNQQALLKQTADYNHANSHGHPLIMDAGDYLKVTFGAAQTANAYCSCVVLEVNV